MTSLKHTRWDIQRVYFSSKTGRNRVCRFSDPSPRAKNQAQLMIIYFSKPTAASMRVSSCLLSILILFSVHRLTRTERTQKIKKSKAKQALDGWNQDLFHFTFLDSIWFTRTIFCRICPRGNLTDIGWSWPRPFLIAWNKNVLLRFSNLRV